MLKKWIAEALIAIASITSTTSLHGSETASQGKVITQQVESSYKEGDYNSFLTQLHEQYENAGKAGVLRGLFESTKKASEEKAKQDLAKALKENLNRSELERESEQEILAERENLPAHIQQLLRQNNQLLKERDQKLLDAIAENPELEIVTKVDAVVFHKLPKEQKKALREIETLKYHLPETTEATVENKISALETEYYIKSILLSAAVIHKGEASENFHEKKIALQLEKLDRMQAVAKDANEKKWEQKIADARVAYLAKKALSMDLEGLNDLAVGKVEPKNPVEEKVKQIMMEYQTKMQENYELALGEFDSQ